MFLLLVYFIIVWVMGNALGASLDAGIHLATVDKLSDLDYAIVLMCFSESVKYVQRALGWQEL